MSMVPSKVACEKHSEVSRRNVLIKLGVSRKDIVEMEVLLVEYRSYLATSDIVVDS